MLTKIAVGIAGVLSLTAAGRSPVTLHATVGLSTIKLTMANGQPVRSLRAGVFRVVVVDRSNKRNFHLTGPIGTVNRTTTLPFVGTVSWTLRLTKGSYLFYSDKGRSLKGAFKVK